MAGGRGERPRRAATACPSSLPSPAAPARGRWGARGTAACRGADAACRGADAARLCSRGGMTAWRRAGETAPALLVAAHGAEAPEPAAPELATPSPPAAASRRRR